MKYLSKLTPAETLIVLTGDKTPLSELLKYTFMDLLLKQVLSIKEVQEQASDRDPVRVIKYVREGENFNQHQDRLHESVILSVFQKTPDVSILFRNLVKIAYQNAKHKRHYYPQLTENSNLREAFSTSIFEKLFCKFSYTQKGKRMKAEVEQEISELTRSISALVATDKTRGIQLLKSIGGNMFLLKGLEFDIAKEIDRELMEEMSKRNSGSGCSSACWVYFGDYSDTFDSSCSSDSSTGCGGNSGCSGCGGCGGCGGD